MTTIRNLPNQIRADAPLWGQLVDFGGSAPVHVEVSVHDDLGQVWRSEAVFQTSPEGTLDLAGSQPAEAEWSGSDAYGLYWSMKLLPSGPSDTGAFLPFFDSATASLNPLLAEVTVKVEGTSVAQGRIERIFQPLSMKEEWRDDFIANLFIPVYPTSSQGTLIIGGSGGGFAWSNQVAALIAASGRAALAVAYFDWNGADNLPTSITEIPLETFCRALDRFKEDPRVLNDDLAVIGFSKGAEAALLLATKRDDIRKVIAYAPSAYAWESARMDPSEPPRSSWTWNGRPLPFAQFTADDEFYRTFDKTRLRKFHERALVDVDAIRKARIAVEETDARILLISGTADSVWPSTPMCEMIVRALSEAGRASQVRHIAFEGAGHFFFLPGMPVNRMDGTPVANANANRKGWGALRKHINLS